jgi:protein-disulfide isomerase
LIYILFAFIGIPAVAFLGHDMSSRSFIQKSTYMINDSLNEWERSPVETFGTPMLTEGSKSPKFTIVEFADFQCIHCKDAVYNLHTFVNSKPDVELQFYSFPLDANCNPALGSGGNGKSCVLAKATYCSEKQGKGWAAHGWIFDRFATDENSAFESMAKDLGLDYAALNACIQSDEANEFILAQAKLGQQVKVEGTPTIFINGKKLPGGNIVAVLEALYKKLHP